MARAQTRTKLALDEWARLFGLDPLHFNGVEYPEADPGRSNVNCNHVFFQYAWQNTDAISREDIAQAIAEAEAQIEEALGYHLMPTWDYDEWRPTVRPFRPELVVNNRSDVRGMPRIVKLNWGYFISGGIEAVTLLSWPGIVQYVDNDGDGYAETAVIQNVAATEDIDPSEIEIHFRDDDLIPGYDEGHRIRPIHVNKADNGDDTFTYTITCRREQLLVVQNTTRLPQLTAYDGGNDDYFLTHVNVYRRYNDGGTQARLMWENGSSCGCDGGCSSCVYAMQSACLLARQDPRQSIVSYLGDNECLVQGRDPDVIRAFYRSGWQVKQAPLTARQGDIYNQMDPHWSRIVANFAAAKLDRPVCDCGPTAAQIDWCTQDLAYSHGDATASAFSISPKDLNNPWGTKRGAVLAWKAVAAPALGRSA